MQFFTILSLLAAQASAAAFSLRSLSGHDIDADAAGIKLEVSAGANELHRRATLDAFSTSVLTTHNAARTKYGASALTYATSLNASVASYAAACVFQHSDAAGKYGENLYAATSSSTTMSSAVNSWMAEEKSYNYSKPAFSDATGHFTQVVWKATTEVACSMAFCKKGTIFADYSARYIVCRYTPPGNYAGEFAANVGEPTTV